MIYYAAFPAELVFDGCDRFAPQYQRIPFARGSIVVEAITPTSLRIVSLASSEIQDYLNPHLQPGRVIELLSDNSG